MISRAENSCLSALGAVLAASPRRDARDRRQGRAATLGIGGNSRKALAPTPKKIHGVARRLACQARKIAARQTPANTVAATVSTTAGDTFVPVTKSATYLRNDPGK